MRVDGNLCDVETGQPRAQWFGRGQLAGTDQKLGPVAFSKGAIAQDQVVMGDRRWAPPRPRKRVGEQRNPLLSAEPRQRLWIVCPAACDDGNLPRWVWARSLRSSGRRRHATHPRCAVAASRHGVVGEGAFDDERLAQREVEMDGARSIRECRPVRPARERPHPAYALDRGLLDSHIEEPLDRIAVELELVDRLTGSHLA